MILTQISRARHYLTFNISETIQERYVVTAKWCVAYWIVPSPMTLIYLQSHVSYFVCK